MRHSSDVVLPNKKPPSGGTPAAKRLPHACRAQARRLAQPPATQFPNHADSGRRDDRAMMTQGCAGRRELPFTSFPACPKSGRTNARRSLSAISARLSGKARSLREQKKIPGVVLLSHSQIYSTIAAGALNCRVREGNVCFCSAIDTGNIIPISKKNLSHQIQKKLKSVRIDLSCKKNSRRRATLP